MWPYLEISLQMRLVGWVLSQYGCHPQRRKNWTERQMSIRDDNVKAHRECPPEAKKNVHRPREAKKQHEVKAHFKERTVAGILLLL